MLKLRKFGLIFHNCNYIFCYYKERVKHRKKVPLGTDICSNVNVPNPTVCAACPFYRRCV